MFKNDQYSAIIKENNGRFFVICDTFNIITECNNLSDAYAEMKKAREDMLERFSNAGITPPSPTSGKLNKLTTGQPSFFVKTLLITGIILASLTWLFAPFANILTGIISPLANIKERYVKLVDPKNLSLALEKVASTLKEVTPQKKEEIRANLHIIVREIAPFSDELRPLFDVNIYERKKEKTISLPQEN